VKRYILGETVYKLGYSIQPPRKSSRVASSKNQSIINFTMSTTQYPASMYAAAARNMVKAIDPNRSYQATFRQCMTDAGFPEAYNQTYLKQTLIAWGFIIPSNPDKQRLSPEDYELNPTSTNDLREWRSVEFAEDLKAETLRAASEASLEAQRKSKEYVAPAEPTDAEMVDRLEVVINGLREESDSLAQLLEVTENDVSNLQYCLRYVEVQLEEMTISRLAAESERDQLLNLGFWDRVRFLFNPKSVL
jgi:hypothetical protein